MRIYERLPERWRSIRSNPEIIQRSDMHRLRERTALAYRFVIEAIKAHPQATFWTVVALLILNRFV